MENCNEYDFWEDFKVWKLRFKLIKEHVGWHSCHGMLFINDVLYLGHLLMKSFFFNFISINFKNFNIVKSDLPKV